MSGGHAHGLYIHSRSPIHRTPPECKVAAAFLFVVAVVVTPRTAVWAFGLHLLIVVAAARAGRVPLRFVVRRLAIEIPFLLFAVFLPFLSPGDRTEVLGLSLSIEGLWGAFNIAAKATLGAAATVLLAATTPVAQILLGLERMNVPRPFVAIAHFMIRYGDVITGEMRRMRIARASRGYDPRWLWQAKAVGASLGSLFIRSYERGERVYLAMLARGYAGAVPVLDAATPTHAQWGAALAVPVLAGCVAALAWTVMD